MNQKGRTIILFAIDVDAYFDLIDQGFWVGFKMPELIRGGN